MNIDWNQTIEQLPDNLRFDDLPPLARDLILRNVDLRTRLNSVERQLDILTIEDIEVLLGENKILNETINQLEETIKQLEEKLDNFRGMISRRDKNIQKMKKR